ncbi:MAG: hypothetical protein C0504_07180 [Candidatus Solibacter sp.]|nr:hypothetical protein [Candidatus Solibacter sp.]
MITGSHNVKPGCLGMRSLKNQDNQPATNGSVNFSPGHPPHSGNPLAGALPGNFNCYTEASGGPRLQRASARRPLILGQRGAMGGPLRDILQPIRLGLPCLLPPFRQAPS